jgi:hypothetical protein
MPSGAGRKGATSLQPMAKRVRRIMNICFVIKILLCLGVKIKKIIVLIEGKSM